MKKISAYQLGGTLFVPATHKYLDAIVEGKKFTDLYSMVIDCEDGIEENSLDEVLEKIKKLLPQLTPSKLLRFIRPANVKVLQQILEFEGSAKIDGFVLPKFDEDYEAYLQVVEKHDFNFMPSIEGKALFDVSELQKLRHELLPYKEKIICVRFGAEDMLKQLSIQRVEGKSLSEMLVPSMVMANLLSTFKPFGFELSAPVFKYFKDEQGFKDEVRYELENGFVSKTIIHPNQSLWLKEIYKVDDKELQKAEAILKTLSVANFEGEMLEGKTQKEWAENILLRNKIYNFKTT